MGQNKLAKFAENKTFDNMFELPFGKVQEGMPLRGKWHQEFFKNNNPIVLELGCGKGEYTVGLGTQYPAKNFIGMDIKGARMWRGCKTSNDTKMSNIAFIRTHIQFIERCFAPNEVSEIWITFPDPQLQKVNKRLTSPRFLSYYRKILVPNSIIHLKTDSAELYEYTMEMIQQEGHHLIFNSDDLYQSGCKQDVMSIQTFYEKMWLDMGKKITYIQFQLKEEK